MALDFESVTDQSKKACFHKCSCPVKHIRYKNLPVKSVYTKKTGDTSSNSILTKHSVFD